MCQHRQFRGLIPLRRVVPARCLGVLLLAGTCPAPGADQPERDAKDPAGLAEKLPAIRPLEPSEALGSFRTLPGFRVELVAAEPLIRDPVAIDFDARGRIFVVEFPEYNQKYVRDEVTDRGRVRMLEDTDGDGRMDRSTIYVDNLSYATAVACHDGGVFVGVTPDILYCKDTDGDGVADIHRVALTGFAHAPGRAGQAQLNSFRWGLDNRFHVCTNLSGGNVRRAGDREAVPVNVRNRDIRFDPRTLEFEATSGGGQHGMSFDDWGRKFTSKNSEPFRLIHYEERYLQNNPYLKAPAPAVEITEARKYTKLFRISGDEPWRVLRTRMRAQGLFAGPVEGPEGTAAPSGYFTAATGVTVYRGDQWPEEFRGDAFVGEVASNILYRAELEPDGVGLVARRADAGREFLASTDNWFRPVQLANGPDGALYVLDIYRFLIEGAAFLPPEVLRHIEVTGGVDRGRIYRIVFGDKSPGPPPDLESMPSSQLVNLLEHPNAWHRETSARLLYTRQDLSVVESLRALAGASESALGRMHARYTLQGLVKPDEEVVLEALHDSDPRARVHALRLAEDLAPASEAVADAIHALTRDHDLTVRYQAAFSLGALSGPGKVRSVRAVLQAEGENPWMQLAALSAAGAEIGTLFLELLKEESFRKAGHGDAILVKLASQLAQADDREDLQAALNALEALVSTDADLVNKIVRALLENCGQATRRWLAGSGHATVDQVLTQTLERARATAFDEKKSDSSRAAAIRVLGLSDFKTIASPYGGLLKSRQPRAVQSAALTTLGRFSGDAPARILLDAWPGLSPALRARALEILSTRAEWAHLCLAALEDGTVNRGEFGSALITSFREYPDEKVRRRARALFSEARFQERTRVSDSYRESLKLSGNVTRGREVFSRVCAACHRLEKVGVHLGADLSAIGAQGAETILLHILDPNRDVKPEFVVYTVTTDEGLTHAGLIAEESANGITLRRLDGSEVEILRVHIEGMNSLGISYMPEGLEAQVDVEAMADLLAYLETMR